METAAKTRKQSAPRTRKQSAPKRSTTRRSVPILAGLVLAALIVVVVVVLASGDDDSGRARSSEAARIPAGSIAQVAGAATEGPALPRFDDSAPADPALGLVAPMLRASFFDGAEVTIDPSDGRPRIMLFLAHWCPHCQAEATSLSEWFAANGLPDDVEVVAISTNVDQGAPNYPPSDWFLREQWPVPVLRDSSQNDLAAGYGLSGFPYAVVVDSGGRVIHRQTGAMDTAQWEALLVTAAES